jgi:hypothetical protein
MNPIARVIITGAVAIIAVRRFAAALRGLG